MTANILKRSRGATVDAIGRRIPRRPVTVTNQLATLMSQLRNALISSPELSLDQITEEDLMNTHFRTLEPIRN